MSTYALSTLFPSSSCHNDHATSSSHQIASHTHPIPQYQSCQQTPSTNEVTSGNAEKLECVDIAVTNANLDPRSLYKRRGKKEKYFSSAQSRKFEAVTFELKITFNRRQYTVRRPFYRLRNLHAELVKECEKLGMVMPELPTRYDSEGNPYSIPVMFPIARSGLSMLQSTMYSYTPVVDGWFSHVCKALPRSPSLINFIWEPPERKMEQQLASINEEEEEDEIDDDDDDYYMFGNAKSM
mmetsp:Transcript_3746/g.3855  ORF Transcript_3746/g.3855 Transcript_3746/m.3855 type:complete len:239 (-) Transcript_3746:121-837(-)